MIYDATLRSRSYGTQNSSTPVSGTGHPPEQDHLSLRGRAALEALDRGLAV